MQRAYCTCRSRASAAKMEHETFMERSNSLRGSPHAYDIRLHYTAFGMCSSASIFSNAVEWNDISLSSSRANLYEVVELECRQCHSGAEMVSYALGRTHKAQAHLQSSGPSSKCCSVHAALTASCYGAIFDPLGVKRRKKPEIRPRPNAWGPTTPDCLCRGSSRCIVRSHCVHSTDTHVPPVAVLLSYCLPRPSWLLPGHSMARANGSRR